MSAVFEISEYYTELLFVLGFLFIVSTTFFWLGPPKLKLWMIGLTVFEFLLIFLCVYLYFSNEFLAPHSIEDSYILNVAPHEVQQILPPTQSDDVVGNDVFIYSVGVDVFPSNIKALIKKGETLEHENMLTEAQNVYKSILQLPNINATPLAKGMVLFLIANIDRMLDNSLKALEVFHEAYDIFHKAKHIVGMAETLNRVGRTAYQLGDFKFAQHSFEQSLKMGEKAGNKNTMASSHIGLGNIARVKGGLDAASEHYAQAFKHYQSINKIAGIAYALLNKGRVMVLRGKKQEAQTYIQQSLSLFKGISHDRGRHLALLDAGNIERMGGQLEKAEVYYGQALSFFTRTKDRRYEAITYLKSSISDFERGRSSRALTRVNQAIKIFQQIKDKRFLSKSYIIRANVLKNFGLLEEALSSVKKAREFFPMFKSQILEAEALHAEGRILQILGSYYKSEELFAKACQIYKSVGFTARVGISLLYQGSLSLQKVDYTAAHTNFYKALRIFKDLDNLSWQSKTLAYLAELAFQLDDYNRAKTIAYDAINITRLSENTLDEARSLTVLGKVEFNLGDYTRAEAYYEKAILLFESIHYKRGLTYVLAEKGVLYLLIGRIEEAEKIFQRALILARETKYLKAEAKILAAMASIKKSEGKLSQSIAEYKGIIHLLKDKGMTYLLSRMHRRLSNVYIVRGDFDEALKQLKICQNILSSMPQRHNMDDAQMNMKLAVIKLKTGHISEARSLLEDTIFVFKQAGRKRLLGSGYYNLSRIYTYIGNNHNSLYYLEKSENIFRALGDVKNLSRVLACLGNMYYDTGNFLRAQSYFTEGLSFSRRAKNKVMEGVLLMQQADADRFTMSEEAARKKLKNVLKITEESEDQIGRSYGDLILSYYDLSNLQIKKSRERAKRALSNFLKMGHLPGQLRALRYLGDIASTEKDFITARKHYNEALLKARNSKMGNIIGKLLRRLGYVDMQTGHYDSALKYLEEGLFIAKKHNDIRGEARVLRHIAMARAFLLNEYTYPRELLQKALRSFKENNDFIFEIDTFVCMGSLELLFDNREQAKLHFEKALNLSQHTNNILNKTKTNASIGDCYYKYGDSQSAVHFYKESIVLAQHEGGAELLRFLAKKLDDAETRVKEASAKL